VEALSGIAEVLMKQDRLMEARAYFEKAVHKGGELSLWDLVVPALRSLAACEKAFGRQAAAQSCLKELLATIEDLLAPNLTKANKQRYTKIKSEILQEIPPQAEPGKC